MNEENNDMTEEDRIIELEAENKKLKESIMESKHIESQSSAVERTLESEIKQLKENYKTLMENYEYVCNSSQEKGLEIQKLEHKLEKIDELTNDWERIIVSASDASKLRKILNEKL